MSESAPQIDLELFRLCLDAEEDDLADLMAAARATAPNLPHLLLSILHRDGHPLGSGARDELRRARHRAEDYRGLHRILAAEVGCRVLKGPALGRLYPDGLLRPVGDLELAVADEPALWRAVRRVRRERPVQRIDVCLMGADHRHVSAVLHWPSLDPLLDGPNLVEIRTAALPGNFRTVVPRTRLPEHPWTAGLLAVAEERFQRPFGPRDAMDMFALAGADCAPGPEAVAEQMAGLHMEPEVVELLHYAGSRADLGPLEELRYLIAVAADREVQRREEAEAHGSALSAAWEDGDGRCPSNRAGGLPIHGLPLRPVETGREDWQRVRLREFDEGTLLLTPVGDYLLAGRPLVSSAQYDSACRELDRLDAVAG
ncbi:hypothetical protein ACFPZ0_01075 [Streptomonospora nanhaiensis]|uniref:Uncharacterized protein n=1 Tax=Streptomonospora nanhaiensis TaxID=1323731 RepID=A0A853BHS4_9ACTN|nr:hypothetical protein [Streptomonospora nanhaiensis]MBV2364589.1 nucleotidyltransferase family protein [Streptomonospora nanhaiensis]MBX9387511.1 nucleotidyltransferase family protein [Streptomonospora nanhaiensis]NYI94152.1 hypothetical protein [Streptomonospora nanhaiensis]